MNETSAVVINGVKLEDKLYLSIPVDTTGLKWEFLNEELAEAKTAEKTTDTN